MYNPAHNGEAPPSFSEAGDAVENPLPRSPGSKHDPVTTEAKAEMEFLSQDKSMDSIRRRPSLIFRNSYGIRS